MWELIDELIKEANEQLKQWNGGITIERRGKRLYLRGTLPPKPGSNRKEPHQQNIALGLYANPQGLKQAIKESKKVSALVACKEFDWKPYIKRKQLSTVKTFAYYIEAFKNDFFSFSRSKYKDKRWKVIYRVLKLLPQDEEFTKKKFEIEGVKIINSTESISRKRLACRILHQFANFMEQKESE